MEQNDHGLACGQTMAPGTADAARSAVARGQRMAAARGIVIYLHGIQSHGGWYEGSCRALAAAGLRVYFPDRRGSGLNAGERGHVNRWEQLADDIVRLEELAEREWHELGAGRGMMGDDLAAAGGYRRPPVVLAGVSWGGKLATALAAMHGGRYAGIALLCPGIKPQRDVSLGTKISIARAVLGKRGREMFPIPLSEPSLFTATPRWLEFLRQDELSLRQASGQFLFESRRLDGYLEESGACVHEPVLLMLAGRDRIIDNAATLAYTTGLGSADVTVRLYGKAHHTLEFEDRPGVIFDDLSRWCLRRCAEYGA